MAKGSIRLDGKREKGDANLFALATMLVSLFNIVKGPVEYTHEFMYTHMLSSQLPLSGHAALHLDLARILPLLQAVGLC